ncbi:MAG TPA: hypothetical protein VLA12_04980 [Planctomycetaceae bacterium]|nr:hypothetical protein [Planctomycetaceae bacterium]
MNITRTICLLTISLVFLGCTREPRSTPAPLPDWSRSLSEEETARCKQVAWDAANSREMAERFQLKRTTTGPMKLDADGIKCHLDHDSWDRVNVTIPDHGPIDIHGYYISVIVARGTFEVIDLRGIIWP